MPEKSTVVFVIGPAGSGKSTVARKLATSLRATYLDKDTLAGPLVRFAMHAAGHEPDAREHNAYYREQVMPLEYQALFEVARDNLLVGRIVVVDAPFAAYLSDPEYLNRMKDATGWPTETSVVVAKVAVSQARLIARLEARGSERDSWKLQNWEDFWARYGTADCRWAATLIVEIDNNEAEPELHNVMSLVGAT